MGVAVDDIDGDGSQDFFVTHLAGESNAMFLNEQGQGFREAAVDRGLGVASFDFTGFGTAFSDLEFDGDLDLVVVNGRVTLPRGNPHYPHLRDVGGLNEFWRPFAEPKMVFVNDGAGHFTSVASAEDDFLSTLSVSRGLCAGDVDNDGDVDFLVINAASRGAVSRTWRRRKGIGARCELSNRHSAAAMRTMRRDTPRRRPDLGTFGTGLRQLLLVPRSARPFRIGSGRPA